MFIERNINTPKKTGAIEVIAGSMFSGKTEELIRRLKRAKIARQKVEIFKPVIDVRYSATEVVSHDENSIHSTPVSNSANILLLTGNVDVVGIDEAQFFDKGLVEVVVKLAPAAGAKPPTLVRSEPALVNLVVKLTGALTLL